ncbi:PEP-CTERM sorting domain-containing protein [Sphingomonas sp.]|jgi:hypothetical protein|uniref:PEP-CTERM sorting domain-containing protein n=1 Tax=Sphingomonas sp. TaxID=28214 RepID=UPI002EDA8CD7
MKTVLAALLGLLATPAAAQSVRPRTILFIGNSFTQGALSPVRRYRPETVTDLTREGQGGVPALFKTFAEQAGLSYAVSLETQGGRTLGFHYDQRRQLFARAWDVVVLQEYSTLDPERPGDATAYQRDAVRLAQFFTRANPAVDVELVATWTRADLTYRPGSPWSGRPVGAMASDLAAAARTVRAASPDIDGVIAVGEAWNRAFAQRIADANPYDGIGFGQVDLWAHDQYHASVHGYYLEALMIFGKVTGVDPRSLGERERAAEDLGIAPTVAVALQRIAAEQLAAGADQRASRSSVAVKAELPAPAGTSVAKYATPVPRARSTQSPERKP